MSQAIPPKRPKEPKKTIQNSSQASQSSKPNSSKSHSPQSNIATVVTDAIKQSNNLKDYSVRDLVKHAEQLGPRLKEQDLKASQIRKFLDVINQIKINLAVSDFSSIESEVILLKPKLAYATAKQNSVAQLKTVLTAAIERVHDKEDFERLVQMIESIIAYHKAGSKN